MEQTKAPRIKAKTASSLLALERDRAQAVRAAGGSKWLTGIPVIDGELPANLWTGGSVIGLGSIDSHSPKAPSLSIELTTTHLIEQARARTHTPRPRGEHQSQSQSQTVFILSPPQQATSSIQRVYSTLSTRITTSQQALRHRHHSQAPPPGHLPTVQPSLTPKSLLDGISLLQYLDIPGLLESLAEVSTVLYARRASSSPTRTIVVVQGLTTTLNALHRHSGLVPAATLLNTVLLELRSLAKTQAGACLVLVEWDVAWGGEYISPNANTNSSANNNWTRPLVPAMALSTAFMSMTGKVLRLGMQNTLAGLVEAGMDLMVVVHDGEGRVDVESEKRRIVEVVRDERIRKGIGGAFQSWCVWE